MGQMLVMELVVASGASSQTDPEVLQAIQQPLLLQPKRHPT